MKEHTRRLNKLTDKTDDAVQLAQEEMKSHIDFDFHISYVHGCLWALGDNEYVMPLSVAEKIIREKGILTTQDLVDNSF